MPLDFKNLNMKQTLIAKDLINNLARPSLSSAMECKTAYLLKGNLLNQHDYLDEWTLLIPKKNGLAIASDKPHPESLSLGLYKNDSYNEVILDSECIKKLFYLLMKIYNVTIMDNRKKGGRKPSCTEDDIKEMVELRSKGMTNRAIARQKKISPATVGKWLEKYDLNQIEGVNKSL